MIILKNIILLLLAVGFTEIVISIWFGDYLLPMLEQVGIHQELISKVFITEIVTGLCLLVSYIVLSLQHSKK